MCLFSAIPCENFPQSVARFTLRLWVIWDFRWLLRFFSSDVIHQNVYKLEFTCHRNLKSTVPLSQNLSGLSIEMSFIIVELLVNILKYFKVNINVPESSRTFDKHKHQGGFYTWIKLSTSMSRFWIDLFPVNVPKPFNTFNKHKWQADFSTWVARCVWCVQNESIGKVH